MASGNHPRRRRPGASLLNGWPRRDLTDAVAASLLLSVEALLTAFGCSSWRVRLPLWVVSARPRRLRAAVGPRRRRRLRHTKSERPLPSITTFRYRPANACYLVRTGHPRKKRPQAAMGRRRTVTKLTSLPESRNSSRDSKTGPSRPTAAGQCELMALPGPLPVVGQVGMRRRMVRWTKAPLLRHRASAPDQEVMLSPRRRPQLAAGHWAPYCA